MSRTDIVLTRNTRLRATLIGATVAGFAHRHAASAVRLADLANANLGAIFADVVPSAKRIFSARQTAAFVVLGTAPGAEAAVAFTETFVAIAADEGIADFTWRTTQTTAIEALVFLKDAHLCRFAAPRAVAARLTDTLARDAVEPFQIEFVAVRVTLAFALNIGRILIVRIGRRNLLLPSVFLPPPLLLATFFGVGLTNAETQRHGYGGRYDAQPAAPVEGSTRETPDQRVKSLSIQLESLQMSSLDHIGPCVGGSIAWGARKIKCKLELSLQGSPRRMPYDRWER